MKKIQAKSQNFQMRNAPHKVSKKLAWKEPNFNSCVSQKKTKQIELKNMHKKIN